LGNFAKSVAGRGEFGGKKISKPTNREILSAFFKTAGATGKVVAASRPMLRSVWQVEDLVLRPDNFVITPMNLGAPDLAF
jgi:hypothetical protein